MTETAIETMANLCDAFVEGQIDFMVTDYETLGKAIIEWLEYNPEDAPVIRKMCRPVAVEIMEHKLL